MFERRRDGTLAPLCSASYGKAWANYRHVSSGTIFVNRDGFGGAMPLPVKDRTKRCPAA